MPVLEVDFFCMGNRGDLEKASGLTIVDCPTGSVACTGLPSKECSPYLIEFLLIHIEEWGYIEIVVQADQEPAMNTILSELKRRRVHCTLLRRAPRYSHQSMGHAEQANAALEALVRTIALGGDTDTLCCLGKVRVILSNPPGLSEHCFLMTCDGTFDLYLWISRASTLRW